MKFNLISFAIKNLRRKAFRTSMLVVSIALMVSVLVFGTSFIVSVDAGIKGASARLGADLLVVPIGARDSAEEVLLETKQKAFYMDKGIIERVKRVKGVKDVTYQTYLSTIMGMCCDIPAAKVVIFDQDTDFVITPWLEKSIGRRLGKGEAIVGANAYEFFDVLDVSRSVFFNTTFHIVGKLLKTGTGLDNAILMNSDNFLDIYTNAKIDVRPDQISVIFVRVESGADPYQVGRNVEGDIIEVDVTTRSDMGKRIIGNMTDLRRIFTITMLLAGALSAVLAWSVFSAIANERSREVAIMRAIGAKGSHVASMFFLEVLLLGVAGSMLGVALGTALSITLGGVFTILKDLPVTLGPDMRAVIAIGGLLAGTAICVSGALSSMLRLKGLDPLDALKEG